MSCRYGHKQPGCLHNMQDSSSSSNGGSSNNIGCDFCNMAVEYIKLALHNNKTTAEIEEVRVSIGDCLFSTLPNAVITPLRHVKSAEMSLLLSPSLYMPSPQQS